MYTIVLRILTDEKERGKAETDRVREFLFVFILFLKRET